jgi:hypothetical protein
MPGFRLVAKGKDGADVPGSVRVASPDHSSLAGIGAAVFLLAFVAIEALATISTLRR